MEIITNNAQETKDLGQKLAKTVLKMQGPIALSLDGQLGGGKTTFLQGFAQGLGVDQDITSPTFVIYNHYPIANPNFMDFYHFDCYRLQNEKDLTDLGANEIFANPQNIIAIEWAQRVKSILPANTIYLEFIFIDENKREIKITNEPQEFSNN